MARDGEADLALLQEAGRPPGDAVGRVEYEDSVFVEPDVVRPLAGGREAVQSRHDRAVPAGSAYQQPGGDAIGVSGIGTIAAARVIPRGSEAEAFIAASMYAAWLDPHPSAKTSWMDTYADASAHRILSDLSVFISPTNRTKHRILAAGDLNMFYGATGSRLSMPERERTVWGRMEALGLVFLGPQAPHGRSAESAPDDVPHDTKNVPTFYRSGGPEAAVNQPFSQRGAAAPDSFRTVDRDRGR